MTDRSKFEQMLEYLISEDHEKAREVFHQIVVEKSREIYENILSEDFQSVEESDKEEDEDDETVEENFGFAEAPGEEIGGDPTDAFMGDVSADDEFGGEDEFAGADEFGGEDEFGAEGGDIEDRVVDLEDALDDLKAEFEKLLGDEAGEPEHDDVDFGGDDEGEEEFGGDEEEGDDEEKKEGFVREYVEKVSAAKMGDNGQNTKSVLAKKNDMGGTTANLRGGESKGEGTKGGLLNPSTKEDNAGNVNVPGAKKAATLSKVSAPKGGDDGDKGAGSLLNGVKSRAK